MEARQDSAFRPLPGSDALKSAPYFNPNRPLPFRSMRRYYKDGGHRLGLENPAYNHYIHMHKVVVGKSGAEELQAIGATLEQEELPTYLDAAGWAYAEAGLASSHNSTVDRVAMINKAERVWARGLINTLAIKEAYGFEYRYEDSEGHRVALNLAYAPLMKSIIVGNVQPSALRQTLLDTAEIARDSQLALARAHEREDLDAVAFHHGFLFEASALMALLHMEDPRYVPMPATARADTGYFHRDQTHDISIINQHWGDIRKVIPIEVKSKPTGRHKRRYKALIIPGKARLTIGDAHVNETVNAFYNLAHGKVTAEQMVAVEQLSAQLREMLRLYQKGISYESIAVHSMTRFYESQAVARQYPELEIRPQIR